MTESEWAVMINIVCPILATKGLVCARGRGDDLFLKGEKIEPAAIVAKANEILRAQGGEPIAWPPPAGEVGVKPVATIDDVVAYMRLHTKVEIVRRYRIGGFLRSEAELIEQANRLRTRHDEEPFVL